MLENDCVFIDLDGVILNSEERMLERKESIGLCNHYYEQEFEEYFNYTNLHPTEWDYIIRNASSINGSVEIIKELEKIRKVAILTKIHTLYEMKVKIEDLRDNRKIECPVIFVPPGVKKHNVVLPNGQLLIDDSENNVSLWLENGGNGLVFDKSISDDTSVKVRSLEFLLKR